ncbi:MAG: glycosyltransferase family 2 protein [Bacteroidales bacterium]|nr:glycosyltransferase family 2 protein [Bacteroidales bacterium]MBR1799445.1 glycosyltransferase family 2 protein [Bacteroidales bacterium]
MSKSNATENVMATFTIVMPVWNKAAYVGRAIGSVLAQSRGDWEMIVVDDDSTDNSAQVAESFADRRISVVHAVHEGVSSARNRAATMAKGCYICFLDADDWYEPTFLDQMHALIAHHPDAGLYATAYNIVKYGQYRPAPIGFDEGFTEGIIDYCATYARTLCMPVWTGASCMPLGVFNAMGGFDAELHIGEDFDLWMRTSLNYPVVMTREALSNYNQDAEYTWRASKQLHPPQHNVLWHLDHLPKLPNIIALTDRMKAYALWPYYLSHRYHTEASQLLESVDWQTLPPKEKRRYDRPLWQSRMLNIIHQGLYRCLHTARTIKARIAS